MTFDLRSLIFLIPVYVAFFASGASSLIAEVTWNRMLITVVGNSMSATAMILVAFMGGLGLGSHIGGKFFSGRSASLVPYILLEIAIGAYVFFSPALFDLLAYLFTLLAENVDDRANLTIARIAVSLAALLLPAFLMGATFPAIISAVAPDSSSQRTARTGYLYSTNTLGAAVGCFVAGYFLLGEFGVQTTLACALGLYFVAVVCAFAARAATRRKPSDVPAAAPISGGTGPFVDISSKRFLNIATFGMGFVALAYQVLLTRLGILYLGNSAPVFPVVLTGFLLGTGISAMLGTWLYGLLRRTTQRSNSLFGLTALGAGVFVLLTPYLLLTLSTDQSAQFAAFSFANLVPILAIIVAPTILIGALLPVAIRMLQPEGRGQATREAATLYALNTAGGLLGAGLVNHYLVPLIGVQGILISIASICAAVGICNLRSPGKSFRRWSATTLSVVALAVALALTLPRIIDLYAARLAASKKALSTEVRLIQEGRAATVSVIDQVDPRKGTYRDMYLNGVEEASTRYWHTQLFKLLGSFPVLAHEAEEPKEVLVIAFGAGITAGSVLASDEVSNLDVVDLNPDVEGINDLFTDVNGDVFHKPRFRFHNDDGRNYLVTSNKRYDVIISDSTHPRAYDSWVLYTEEFYQAVKERLLSGGIFAQWVPVLGDMQGDLFTIHLNTFRRVFPNSTFWYVYGSDQAFLLATPEPFMFDVERLQKQLDQLPEWFRAEEYQIDTVTRIAGFFWMDEAAMATMIGRETRVNTDDLHYFDKQSALVPAPAQLRLPRFQTAALPYLDQADHTLAVAIREEQQVAQLVARYGFYRTEEDLFRAYCIMPNNGNVRYFLSRGLPDGKLPDNETFCEGLQIRNYLAAIARQPDDVRAMTDLARLHAGKGRYAEAEPLLRQALAIREKALGPEHPEVAQSLTDLAHLYESQGRHSEAEPLFKRSQEILKKIFGRSIPALRKP